MSWRLRWIAIPLTVALAAGTATACTGQAEPAVTSAPDRPTFVWIFSDP